MWTMYYVKGTGMFYDTLEEAMGVAEGREVYEYDFIGYDFESADYVERGRVA